MPTRDWQLKKNGGQWLLGKAMEAFAPIGPAIVSRDEVGDPNNLQLSCKVRTEDQWEPGRWSRDPVLVTDWLAWSRSMGR